MTVVALAAVMLGAGEGNQKPTILPANSKPGGASYADWGVKWWQWLYAMPATDQDGNITNPIFATGNVDLSMGQPAGNVWYLVGALNVTPVPIEGTPNFEATVERSGNVPSGKMLFFPLLNGEFDNVGLPETDYSIEQLTEWLAASIDGGEPYAIIDGVPVGNLNAYRAASGGPFSYQLPDTSLPAANVVQYLLGDPSDPLNFWNYVVGPVYDNPGYNPAEDPTPPTGENCPYVFTNDPIPAVSDGYWLMLAPLPVGRHTIEFGGTLPWGFDEEGNVISTFTIAITYTIDVVPGNK
jgi:hypothetical protein